MKYLPKKIDLKTLLFETIFTLQELANKKNIKVLDTISENEFVFADKRVIVEATCDSLADYLESVLPCDAGHDFVKADTELDISDTLT